MWEEKRFSIHTWCGQMIEFIVYADKDFRTRLKTCFGEAAFTGADIALEMLKRRLRKRLNIMSQDQLETLANMGVLGVPLSACTESGYTVESFKHEFMI